MDKNDVFFINFTQNDIFEAIYFLIQMDSIYTGQNDAEIGFKFNNDKTIMVLLLEILTLKEFRHTSHLINTVIFIKEG